MKMEVFRIFFNTYMRTWFDLENTSGDMRMPSDLWLVYIQFSISAILTYDYVIVRSG